MSVDWDLGKESYNEVFSSDKSSHQFAALQSWVVISGAAFAGFKEFEETQRRKGSSY
jgi:hypothetical protein